MDSTQSFHEPCLLLSLVHSNVCPICAVCLPTEGYWITNPGTEGTACFPPLSDFPSFVHSPFSPTQSDIAADEAARAAAELPIADAAISQADREADILAFAAEQGLGESEDESEAAAPSSNGTPPAPPSPPTAGHLSSPFPSVRPPFDAFTRRPQIPLLPADAARHSEERNVFALRGVRGTLRRHRAFVRDLAFRRCLACSLGPHLCLHVLRSPQFFLVLICRMFLLLYGTFPLRSRDPPGQTRAAPVPRTCSFLRGQRVRSRCHSRQLGLSRRGHLLPPSVC